MPINIIHEKKYANGLTYYTDGEGNVINHTPTYNIEEQYYIDEPYEKWKADDLEYEENMKRYRAQKERNAKMFLIQEHEFTPSPRHFGRGTPLPMAIGTMGESLFNVRQPLWGKYWAERELCLLAGDTGSGKTLLALQVAKALAGGCVLGNADNVGKPRKVLYVDFELDKQGFYTRFAPDDTLENLYWAGYNQNGVMPNKYSDAMGWMLDNIDTYLDETGAEVLIIDQPDRLHTSPQQWLTLLNKIKKLMQVYGIAVMLVVNTKPRNYARPMELSHIYNHRILCQAADCIIGIGVNYNDWFSRYIKPFKIKNRPINFSEKLEGFIIDHPSLNPSPKVEGLEELFLQIFLTAPQDEEDFLKPSKTKLREQKMIAAESMRRDGLYTDHIAEELGVPETIVKRWVRGIKPKPKSFLNGSPPAKEGNESRNQRFSGERGGLYALPPTDKPDELSEEEWAECVNNPQSPNYDEFAYNPYLLDREQREIAT
jgi:hypothetical protein